MFCSMASSRMWACTCGVAQGRGSGLADNNDSKGSQSLVPVFGCCDNCCLWDLLPSPSESSTFSLFSFAIIHLFLPSFSRLLPTPCAIRALLKDGARPEYKSELS